MGDELRKRAARDLLLHVYNQVVVHICNSFVSTSSDLIRELRSLKAVLDSSRIFIRAQWLPSVRNRYAEFLSRQFPCGELQISRSLRRSVTDRMKAPLDAFKYRPTGEHPTYLRQTIMSELDAYWSDGAVRLLCPPVDLLLPTVITLNPT